jgi:hypothetical protein
MYDVSFVSDVLDALVLLILWVGSVGIGTVVAHYVTKE